MYPVTNLAVTVLVGPCCPALLNRIDVDVHVDWANKMMMTRDAILTCARKLTA